MTTHFTAGQGALWVQTGGPNTATEYLGCHQIGDIDEPFGDSEAMYCPDPSAPNTFQVVGTIEGAPDLVTTEIVTDVTDALDALEVIGKDKFTLYVNKVVSGRMDIFDNRSRVFILTDCGLTARGLSNLAARIPDDNSRSEQTFGLSASSLIRWVDPTISRYTTAVNKNLDAICCNREKRLRTAQQTALEPGQYAFASGADQTVLRTINGTTWAACATSPFEATDNVSGLVMFPMDATNYRVIAANGTTDAAAPAEIEYSDDLGATWTAVTVGSVNAHFFPVAGSLYAYDRTLIFAATNLGYIHKSVDAGGTWSTVEAGVITNVDILSIHFADTEVGFFCGEGNIVGKTTDGGESWQAVTGPAGGVNLTAIHCFDRYRVWVATANGKLYYSSDGGTNWTERTFIGSGTGAITTMKFFNDLIGYAVRTVTGVSTLLNTINGGYNWGTISVPTNSTINALAIADVYHTYFAGDANASTGYIAKASV